MLNFNNYSIESYGGQDRNSSFNVLNDGATLHLVGNGWKKIALPYTITADTILEFDFKSTAQGEIHGLGFDTNDKISKDLTFQLYGSQSWGLSDFKDYAASAGDWKHYRIEVGQFYTGEMPYLIFSNDHDVSNPTAESFFANIQIYEGTGTATPGSIEFGSPSYSVDEDGTAATITVTRTGGSDGAVSAQVNLTGGNATAGEDFEDVFPIAVNFADGESGSKTITIPIVDDDVIEGTETLDFGLTNLTGGATLGTQDTASLEIVDNDIVLPGTLAFESSSYSVNEDGTAATITVTRTGGSDGAVSAQVNVTGGNATAGEDFEDVFPIAVNFADGESGSKTITIPIVDDDAIEGTETLDFSLINLTGGATLGIQNTTVLSIEDNDTEPPTTAVLNFNNYSIESYGGQDKNSSFNILDDGATLHLVGNGWKKIALPYTITPDTILEFDFKSTAPGEIHGLGFDTNDKISKDLTFQLYGSQSWGLNDFKDYAASAGDWKHYRIEVGQFYTGEMPYLIFSNDHDVGNPTAESFFANIQIYEGMGTVTPGSIEFGSPNYSVNEDGTAATITVTRTGGSDGAVSAQVSVTGGSATAGEDFEDIFPIAVNFADGESGSKTVTIPIVDDAGVEGNEMLELLLSNITGGATLGSQQTTALEIVDNDIAALISDPVSFNYGLNEQELLLSTFDDAGGWQLEQTQIFNGELLANPGAEWSQAHYELSAFNNLDLDDGDIALYWRARADRSQPELAKFFVELNVVDNPIVDGHDEDREIKWNLRPVAPDNGNFNNLPYLLYLDPGWQIPHEVEAELQVPDEFIDPNTYENFRLTLSKTDPDTVVVTPYHWADNAWQAFAPKTGSTLPMNLSIANNLEGQDFFESLTVRFRENLSSLDAFAITQIPKVAPNPRLFLDAAKIDQLKAAIQVAGSHHQATFQAIKARVDQNDWQVYDENPTDGNYNYARSWLAREASLMYLLTDDANYAQIAYDTLYAVHNDPDPDNRVPESGDGLARAMVGMGFAIAYDWAKTGWTQAQQDYIRDKITTALDAWPSYSHTNLASPWGSNWVAVSRGAEVVMMLAAEEEGHRASRYATLKSHLQQHLESAYGPTGWTQEGNGYLAYSGGFLLPAIYALQDVGDTSLDATFDGVEFWRLPMYAGAFDEEQSSLQFGVGGVGFDNEGWTSLLLNAAPNDQRPYYQYFYDQHRGIENPASDQQKFDNRRAGTVWSLLYYPTDTPAANPTGVYAPSLEDDDKGAYFFRNRWQDENDTLVSFMGDAEWHVKGWDQREAFSLGLFAYDTQFISGPGKNTTADAFSTLLVNGATGAKRTTGNRDFFAARDTGGYAIADGGSTYQSLGLDSAKRHLLVDFSGNAGTAILSTLDRLQDSDNNTYTWQLNLGDGEVSATSGSEGGLPTFLLSGHNNSYLKGWILEPTDIALTTDDPLQGIISGTNVDIWAVMVLGTGTAPIAAVTGTGMDAVLELGNALISYDAATNRIITEESPNAIYDLLGTSGIDELTGNAAANTLSGGLGNDLLTGGSGADAFVYHAPNEGIDTIADFAVDDVLHISAAGFGGGLLAGVALSDGVASAAGTFVQGSTPVGTGANFLYDNGILSFDPDGTGLQGATAIATFVGSPSLSSDRIVIIP